MPKFKNTAQGMRGVNLIGGETVWLNPGEVKSFDADALVGEPHADLKETKEAEGEQEEADEDGTSDASSTDDDPITNMSDDELRDLIEDRDGARPHHKLGRDKLLSLARA